jgi:hypothetical protein
MKIVIHANNVPWQKEYLPRFTDGFASHGCRVHHTMMDEADPDAVNVVFANNSWKTTVVQCQKRGYPLITVGRCLFGSRFNMVAIGWDDFNGAADFCLKDEMPSDRWEKHGWHIPFSVRQRARFQKDGFLLVCGEFRQMDQWYAELAKELPKDRVRFRSHPFVKQAVNIWQAAPAAGQDEIATVLREAFVCISYDSIAGCDAVLNGIPSITYGDNAMAAPVSWRSWTEFERGTTVPQMGVEPWAHRLAYCQWSHDEIAAGDFWEHLRGRLSDDP